MSDALPLPPRPNLAQYEKLAKDSTRHTLPAARLLIARAHGFQSWPKFAAHLKGAARSDSTVSKFEAAADAIITGNQRRLKQLLKQNPNLLRARSTRDHRSTLLHYVSANGIEDFRQKTPKNIVEITKLLLDAGADVNAESDAYGGRSTTLGLAATSYHPEAAGVQLPLLELLIERGAIIDGVNACLHNGRGQAAEFLANHGATLDLEAAAGVGRLDVVKKMLKRAPKKQLLDGFAWACEFARNNVVEFLLENAIKADAQLSSGETGLHWAAYKANTETVKLLLKHKAPVNAIDTTHNGTPLAWALYAWGNAKNNPAYYEVVAQLIRAGAKLDEDWFKGDPERIRAAKKLRSSKRMQAALRAKNR